MASNHFLLVSPKVTKQRDRASNWKATSTSPQVHRKLRADAAAQVLALAPTASEWAARLFRRLGLPRVW